MDWMDFMDRMYRMDGGRGMMPESPYVVSYELGGAGVSVGAG